MADDNLKNIENSIKEVGKNVNSAKSDVQDSIDKVESALKKVKNYASDIDNNTKGVKSIKEGVEKVVSKLDALNTIQSWVKNSDNYKDSGKGVRGSIEDKVKNILKRQEEISDDIGKIAIHTKEINWNTRDAADYLKLIKEHIVDGSTGTGTNTAAASNTTGNTDNIHSTVKDILKEIKILRSVIQQKSFTTKNDEVDKLLEEVAEGKARRENEYEKKQAWLRGEDIHGKKLSKERDKELREQFRKENAERERRERQISSKRSGTGIAANIATQTASLISEKQTAGKLADKGISAVSQLGPVGGIIGSLMSLIKAGISLGSERDRATSTYARTIGGGINGKLNVGESISSFLLNRNVNRPALGYEFGEAMSALTEYAEARGRTTEHMSAQDIASSINLKRAGISSEALNNFDTFGKSLEQTDRYFARLYGEVSKKGLSFKNVSKAVNDNLRMAQSHTFANGLRGLQQMAEKSTQLKYNMQQVFQFADKVSELEGAISTSANLSVLGGQFAQFSNPMQMLYEGLNDTEALNDRIVGMFGNKAFWNNQTGQMDMTALNREMVKQAAKAAGLDANEMLSLSLNEGKQRRIASQIMPGTDKTTAEYIKNLGELDERGNAYVTLNGQTKYLNELTSEDTAALKEETERKEAEGRATLGNIWTNTNGIFEKLDKMLAYLQEKLGVWVFGLFQKIVGRDMKNQDNVREWAKANGKDAEDALNFYNEYRNKNTWRNQTVAFGKKNGGTFFSGYNDTYFSEHMDEMLDRFKGSVGDANPEGKSPNGFIGELRGNSHWDGGIRGKLRGKTWEAEGGESLINKLSTAKYADILPKIQNGTFNPYSYANSLVKNDMANHYNSMNVAATQTRAPQNTQNQPNSVNGTIRVDIPQTITINLAGQGMIGNYDISGIISKYVDQFMKEAIMRRDFAGFNKESFYNKTISSAG